MDAFVKILACDKLHRVEIITSLLTIFVQHWNPWMLEHPQRRGFAQEAFSRHWAILQRLGDHFQYHQPSELCISRLVRSTHPSFAKDAPFASCRVYWDLVAPEAHDLGE